jgi:hypothetical protein
VRSPVRDIERNIPDRSNVVMKAGEDHERATRVAVCRNRNVVLQTPQERFGPALRRPGRGTAWIDTKAHSEGPGGTVRTRTVLKSQGNLELTNAQGNQIEPKKPGEAWLRRNGRRRPREELLHGAVTSSS